jgi:hypothetical protein
MSGYEGQGPKFPMIQQDLIASLEKIVPPRDFTPVDSPREIDFYSGKRALINLLKIVKDEQDENLLR